MSWTRRSVYDTIARRLKDDFGSRVHLYVATEAEAKGLREQNRDELWDSITGWDSLNRDITKRNLVANEVVDRARNFETRLGETVNRLTFSHRQFGRGHSPGSYHYPRAPRFERASYLQMIHGYNESLGFWEREIREKNLRLILDGDKVVSSVTRMLNVPFRRMIGSRYKNFWFWTPDEYQSNPAIEPIFRALKEWNVAELTDGYLTSTARTSRYHGRVALPMVLRRSAFSLAQYLWWRLRGYERVNNFDFWGFVTLPLGERQRYRQTRRIATTPAWVCSTRCCCRGPPARGARSQPEHDCPQRVANDYGA